MASITFKNLRNTNQNRDKYTYTDLFLDMSVDNVQAINNFSRTQTTGKDIKVAYDLNAIKNSLTNLFNTLPGERLLLPDYGADLRQYVFEPITELRARSIAREIQTSISKWEPRVKITGLDVIGIEETNEYDITITLAVPFLRESLNIRSLINRSGFTII